MGVLCENIPWDDADAQVRSYRFICLGAEGQRQLQKKSSEHDIQLATTKKLMRILEDIFVMTRNKAFERYNFVCRKQNKTNYKKIKCLRLISRRKR